MDHQDAAPRIGRLGPRALQLSGRTRPRHRCGGQRAGHAGRDGLGRGRGRGRRRWRCRALGGRPVVLLGVRTGRDERRRARPHRPPAGPVGAAPPAGTAGRRRGRWRSLRRCSAAAASPARLCATSGRHSAGSVHDFVDTCRADLFDGGVSSAVSYDTIIRNGRWFDGTGAPVGDPQHRHPGRSRRRRSPPTPLDGAGCRAGDRRDGQVGAARHASTSTPTTTSRCSAAPRWPSRCATASPR